MQATGIREMQRAQQGRAATLGQLLKLVEEQTLKSCDTDKGGCGPAVTRCLQQQLWLSLTGLWQTLGSAV